MSGKTNVLSVRPGRLHTLVRPLSCGYVRAEPLDKAPMELLTSPGSDDLSALLGRINVRSVVYCLSDLSAPWGFRVDGSATAKFHLVLDGQATLTLDDPGATGVTLAAGELVLLPHGSGHLMRDRGDSPSSACGRSSSTTTPTARSTASWKAPTSKLSATTMRRSASPAAT